MQGPAGNFDNVGWPGYVGALTAMAPGRFAAAINQAPLWRRTRHPWLRPYDLALNAMRTWRIRFIPPDHLLREVFETCRDYREARHRLETTPVARPVIYSLVGCERGEHCVIERTEEGFRRAPTTLPPPMTGSRQAALGSAHPRRPDVHAQLRRNRGQQPYPSRAFRAWSGQFGAGRFDWVVPPILNPYTRLAVEMCPAEGCARRDRIRDRRRLGISAACCTEPSPA